MFACGPRAEVTNDRLMVATGDSLPPVPSTAEPDSKEVAIAPQESSFEPPLAPAHGGAGECPDKDDPNVGILVSPKHPRVNQTLHVLAATLVGKDPLAMRVELAGDVLPVDVEQHGGVPVTALATFTPAKPGPMRIIVGRRDQGAACISVRVRQGRGSAAVSRDETGATWIIRRGWDAGEEALYSGWVRHLFRAPVGEELAFKALDQVTSNADRNLLHDHLGAGEDGWRTPAGLKLRPDCADTPYFLRGYFAWKRELPFAFRRCSRGRGGRPPRCTSVSNNLDPQEQRSSPAGKEPWLAAVQHFFRRTLAWGVHTGNGRVALDDDNSDFYPVELTPRGLRPGVIYADPYGHILVVVELVTATKQRPGVLYAIDGQPDGSITRKRFWEGTFLWNPDPDLGGSGFKAFRPLTFERHPDRAVAAMSNRQIGESPNYGDFSLEPMQLDAGSFYDQVEAMIHPGARDPLVALEQAVEALYESAQVRVTSVNNGVEYVRKHPGKVIDMPNGFAIFETTGAWESYSTPARDLRLLIAIDVVQNFEAKVARRPQAYGVTQDRVPQVRQALQAHRDALLASEKFAIAYHNSAGTPVRLTLAALVARTRALETAYNPNDCVEIRWGAAADSEEARLCTRRAPPGQQRKMAAYRDWFRTRRRPPRGDPGPLVP